nr:hypothetical protein [Marinicella sp. W31]MDC2877820.1 hypothetical protein [Marinicella sp. W31]
MEAIGLAIDPYPRKPDAELPADVNDDETVEEVAQEKVSPFAVLKNLKGGG